MTGIIRNASPRPVAAVPPVASPQTEKTVRWKQPVSAEALPGPRASEAHPRALPRGDGGVKFLSALSPEEVRQHLHRPGTEPPPVRPCDTPCDSDKKVRWSAEEIHLATGARKFKNYQHLLQCTKAGKWVDAGEFPMSLGSYTSIPKAKRGKLIDRHLNKYLDVVHLDIGFGDTVSVGGSRYVLVFVDRATRHNWVFGLKTLSPADIHMAFNEVRGEAGRFAGSYCCDCDLKLIGSSVRSYIKEAGSGIISSEVGEQSSTIVSAGEGQQSSNRLVESHWKTMVHMSRAYLTEKQMPQNFWFYSIRHAAQMMNHIPGRYKGKLATPPHACPWGQG